MWLHNHGRMLTVDRLIKWGLNINPTCVFCRAENETRYHLFVECGNANQLWWRLFLWQQMQPVAINTWGQFFQWFIEQTKGKSKHAQVLKMIYAETLYAFWRERNKRIFEGTSRDYESVAREIVCVCNLRPGRKVKGWVQQLYY
nr:uncharacterized protein LOC104120728 [Nicotiana tomentosiformis]